MPQILPGLGSLRRLAACSPFEGLDLPSVGFILQKCSRLLFDAGETIQAVGHSLPVLHMMENGMVVVSRPAPDQAPVSGACWVLQEGGVFGHRQFLCAEASPHRVVAALPTIVTCMHHDVLQWLKQGWPGIGRRMVVNVLRSAMAPGKPVEGHRSSHPMASPEWIPQGIPVGVAG